MSPQGFDHGRDPDLRILPPPSHAGEYGAANFEQRETSMSEPAHVDPRLAGIGRASARRRLLRSVAVAAVGAAAVASCGGVAARTSTAALTLSGTAISTTSSPLQSVALGTGSCASLRPLLSLVYPYDSGAIGKKVDAATVQFTASPRNEGGVLTIRCTADDHLVGWDAIASSAAPHPESALVDAAGTHFADSTKSFLAAHPGATIGNTVAPAVWYRSEGLCYGINSKLGVFQITTYGYAEAYCA